MAEPIPLNSSAPAEPNARQHLDVGTVVAERYRILEVLGEGSMGTVYAVEHLLLKKKMALKVLHPELMSMKNLVIRFEREAMATAKIDHPNVAAAVDFGRASDGAMYLALEFVEGRSLRSEIAKGPMSLSRALHVSKQIASLLAAAQPLGIVHRDLKPENVMLVQRGEDSDFVKVLDFGIARMTGPVEEGSGPTQALTKVGAVFGTPEYMAPEQALGQRVDTRADLYSLGVILFEMIAGVRPYAHAGNQSAILAQQITAPRPSFAEVLPEAKVPEAVERVVHRLLAKGAAERYQRASDVVQILEGLELGAEPVGPSGSLVPARNEALPAFELTTYVPGLTDASRNDSARAAVESTGLPVEAPEHTGSPRGRWRAEVVENWTARGRAILVELRGRFARRFGPAIRGIPPVAIVTFCLGLSIGIVVAIAVWVVAAMKHGGSSNLERTASVSASAAPTVSAAPEASVSAGPNASATALLDGSKDPEVLIGLLQSRIDEGRDSEASGLAVKILSKHPDRRADGRVAEALYRLANSSSKEASDAAFALLEGTMATKGADVLYQLWLDRGVREGTRRRAERWLRSEPFARAASNALVIAVRLRFAESCERKYELLPLAAKGGNGFALAYLRELENGEGCGIDGKSDCYPCLRKDSRLLDAISQIETRSK